MSYQDLEKLDKLDLSKLTLNDVQGLKNESLKKVLTSAIHRGKSITSHQSHGSHSDHVTGPKPP